MLTQDTWPIASLQQTARLGPATRPLETRVDDIDLGTDNSSLYLCFKN